MNPRMIIDSNPVVYLITSGALVVGGYIFGGDATVLLQKTTTMTFDLGFPEWLKDTFQCIAWTGAGVSGFVVGHGWWVKNAQPWIRKRINKKKK